MMRTNAAPPRRRFPRPWRAEELEESFVIRDANDWPIAYLYFEDEPTRQATQKRLSKDEARRIATQIPRLPELLTLEKQAHGDVTSQGDDALPVYKTTPHPED